MKNLFENSFRNSRGPSSAYGQRLLVIETVGRSVKVATTFHRHAGYVQRVRPLHPLWTCKFFDRLTGEHLLTINLSQVCTMMKLCQKAEALMDTSVDYHFYNEHYHGGNLQMSNRMMNRQLYWFSA